MVQACSLQVLLTLAFAAKQTFVAFHITRHITRRHNNQRREANQVIQKPTNIGSVSRHKACFWANLLSRSKLLACQAMHTWLAREGMTLVHGKEVNRRCSKAGLLSHAATSSPLPSITPLYKLAKAGLQSVQSCLVHLPTPDKLQTHFHGGVWSSITPGLHNNRAYMSLL